MLRLLAEDRGSVGAFFEGECLRMSSARLFYQKKRNLLGLIVENFVSVDAFSEGECLRMSSASSFYQIHQTTTLSMTAKRRPIAPPRVRRRREKMQIAWLPTLPIHFL